MLNMDLMRMIFINGFKRVPLSDCAGGTALPMIIAEELPRDCLASPGPSVDMLI
jgi:hypothetical protein